MNTKKKLSAFMNRLAFITPTYEENTFTSRGSFVLSSYNDDGSLEQKRHKQQQQNPPCKLKTLCKNNSMRRNLYISGAAKDVYSLSLFFLCLKLLLYKITRQATLWTAAHLCHSVIAKYMYVGGDELYLMPALSKTFPNSAAGAVCVSPLP